MNPYTVPSEGIRRGCWSCRARRKRCDGQIPKCNTCTRLGIQCAGFGTCRPIWMDGGIEQESYCRRLKEPVKSVRRSGRRKTISMLPTPENSRIEADFGHFSGMSSPTGMSPLYLSDKASRSLSWPNLQPAIDNSEWPNWLDEEMPLELYDLNLDNHNFEISDLVPIHESQCPERPLNSNQSNTVQSERDVTITDSSTDWLFVMRYFDTTVESIFPFYHNFRKDEGRGHILSLAHRSVMVRRSIMSIASIDCEQEQANFQSRQYYNEASALLQVNLDALRHEHYMPSDSKDKLCTDLLVSLVHLILLDVSALQCIKPTPRIVNSTDSISRVLRLMEHQPALALHKQ
jgi:hypothetical protein